MASPTSQTASEDALAGLLASRPVFDAHADSLQRALDLGHDLGRRTPGHLDLERGRAGGLGSLVFVCWVDPQHIETGRARARTLELLGAFHALAADHPEGVRFAGNGALLERAHAAGAVAGIPGIEGGHSIEEDLDHLVEFFECGVRVMTLVWNNHLSWVRSCRGGAGPDVPAGLSPFGRDVVRTMNELGMLVDLSHAGERAFYDALDTSRMPVIASHSGCKALRDHPRNLSDDQLRALADQGGVVGIVFCTGFLSASAQEEEQAIRASEGYQRLSGENETGLYLEQSQFLERAATPLPADVVADHVCHAIEVAGIDHVGLGSDFDGIQRGPQGLEDASCYPNLAHLLAQRGLDVGEIGKVLGGNMERVFRRATGAGTRAHELDSFRALA